MARNVFFSFHYDRDITRVTKVRNSWVVRGEKETQPFVDKAKWEEMKKKGKKTIEDWIETQMKGVSVVVVLVGKETSTREWVIHEIKRAYSLKKGLLAINIHQLKDLNSKTDTKGSNPFDSIYITENDKKKYFSSMYPTYDWVDDDGYNNISKWIEAAAKKAGR